MHDMVIRGGTIIDGTGKAPFAGDVAIAGGLISGVGGKQGRGRREIDAAGLLVTPGWVARAAGRSLREPSRRLARLSPNKLSFDCSGEQDRAGSAGNCLS